MPASLDILWLCERQNGNFSRLNIWLLLQFLFSLSNANNVRRLPQN
jgi:hypothetical protein